VAEQAAAVAVSLDLKEDKMQPQIRAAAEAAADRLDNLEVMEEQVLF
jgi:hypothetical protein